MASCISESPIPDLRFRRNKQNLVLQLFIHIHLTIKISLKRPFDDRGILLDKKVDPKCPVPAETKT